MDVILTYQHDLAHIPVTHQVALGLRLFETYATGPSRARKSKHKKVRGRHRLVPPVSNESYCNP